MINSGDYSGLSSQAGGERVTTDLAKQGLVQTQVIYKMRDWLISRQRYWGAPIPIIHCPECGPVAVPEADLPVRLPDMEDFAPTDDGRSPLARNETWLNTTCPDCGRPAKRETDTMDGFACSSWYFLRFASPHYQEGPFDPAAARYWLPVDTYVGGAEHAVMHLLYARFWTKVMSDAGLIDFDEPFSQLRNQGVLHASDGQRMSKSKGNVVTPDEVGDASQLGIRLLLNGKTMQESNTRQLIFPIDALIAHLSTVCTLSPGDVIFTGTPPGVGAARKPPVFLQPGDEVVVEIERVGRLRNTFVAEA